MEWKFGFDRRKGESTSEVGNLGQAARQALQFTATCLLLYASPC